MLKCLKWRGHEEVTWSDVRTEERLIDGFQEPWGAGWSQFQFFQSLLLLNQIIGRKSKRKSTMQEALLYLEDVKAYSATFVNVWVVDWCGEPSHHNTQWGTMNKIRIINWPKKLTPLWTLFAEAQAGTAQESRSPTWKDHPERQNAIARRPILVTYLIRRALGTHQGCLQPFLGVAHLQVDSRLRWHWRPRAPASRRLQVVDFSPTFPALYSTWQPSSSARIEFLLAGRVRVYFKNSCKVRRLFSQNEIQ